MPIDFLRYRPSEKRLNDFRFWHVEPLLNQAADLLDKCRDELKEFNSLNYNATQLEFELVATTSELKFERERLELNERDLIMAKKKEEFINKTKDSATSSLQQANVLFNYRETQGQLNPGWTKAHQNLYESQIQAAERELNSDINIKQIQWSNSDKKVADKRLILRQEILNKKKELALSGKVLDFIWQRDIVHAQLARNYTDALDRIFMANKGLKIIYGYTINYEEEFNVFTNEPKKINEDKVINNALIWVRNAIEWLVAYGQLDQSFTRVISLFSLLEEDDKTKLLSSGDNCSLSVKVPNILFDRHDNVRLRGIGASLLGNVGIIPWTIEVELPKKVIYKRKGEKNEITQNLPSCLLGRVQNSYYNRNLEICGIISLMNASPYVQESATGSENMWIFRIEKPINTTETFKDLKDILIEFNLIGKLL